MNDPTQETTMDTTPTGPRVTDAMLNDAIVQYRADRPMMIRTLPNDLFDWEEVKRLAEKIHAAMPDAEPTTTPDGPSTYEQSWMDGYCEGHEDGWQRGLRSVPPTTPAPDGLAWRVERLEQHDSIAFQRHGETAERLDAHDAALAELRENQHTLINAVADYRRSVFAPTPPPLVVTEELVSYCFNREWERPNARTLLSSTIRRILEDAGNYVPAGDDQGDTPGTGGA